MNAKLPPQLIKQKLRRLFEIKHLKLNISTMSNIEKTQQYLTSIEDLGNLMLVSRLNLAF